MIQEQYQINYQNHQIDFSLVRSTKRRTVVIQIYYDKVVVRAPKLVSLRDIHAFVKAKLAWIIKQREKIMALPKVPTLTYQTGEIHYFLGKAYTLKLFVGGAHQVKLVRDTIQISAPTKLTAKQVAAKLNRWYHSQSEEAFPAYIAKWHEHPYFHHKPYPNLSIRRMRSRWGSLSQQGEITLNSHLIKASSACIDYVVLHEFCHLLHFNHSPAFYRLVAELMPDWKMRKQALKQLITGSID